MRGTWVVIGVAVAALIGGLALWTPSAAPQVIALDPNGFRATYLIPAEGAQPQVHLIVTSGEMDNQGTEGIPHFVEHLAWLNSVGAAQSWQDRHTNAFTSQTQTEYLVAASDPFMAVSTLAPVLAPLPAVTDFMRSERNVILREYDFRLVENPMADILQTSDGQLYQNDPRRRSVMGAKADIANFSLDEARAWHQSTHRRDNAIWVFYGPITAANAESYVWQAFPTLQSPSAPPMTPRGFVQGPAETIVNRVDDSRFGQDFLNYRKTVMLGQDLDYVSQIAQISLLYDILDSTLQGGYAKPLRFARKTAQSYNFYLTNLSTRDIEFGFIDARPDAGVSLDQLQTAIQAAVQEVARDGIPVNNFDRIKSRWLKRLDAANPPEETLGLSLEAIRLGHPPVVFDDFMRSARAVTSDDLNQLVKALAGPGRNVVDVVTTQKEN